MIWMITFVFFCYCLVLLFFTIVLYRLPGSTAPVSYSLDTFITVLVPVRNEESTIKETLLSILASDYSSYEVVVLDDHSTDRTVEIVKAFPSDKIKLIRLDESVTGKKAAISLGVTYSKAELILSTDGDTIVGPRWLQKHVEAFELGFHMSFGPVKYHLKNFWSKLLNLELSALVGVGAATSSLGFPSMINGCNYSFRRETFLNVGGFDGNENIATGDDEFLLRKIHAKFPDKVKFIGAAGALVTTEPVSSIAALYHQRKRWASKWKSHSDFLSKILPLSVWLVYVGMLSAFLILGISNSIEATFLVGFKLVFDWLFLRIAVVLCGVRLSFIPFILLQIIYPFYVVFFGIASNFGKFHWRDRSYPV